MSLFDNWLEVFLITLIVLMLGFVGIVIYGKSQQETFSLVKTEWECKEAHNSSYTTLIPVGKIMVPQFHNDKVCDVYWRIK
jgi:hypothetical protein